MPAFQTLVNGKRKSDHSDDFSRKRQSTDVGRSRGVQQENEITEEQYWMVQWYRFHSFICVHLTIFPRRKFQFKKHKTWDGDAVLVVNGAKATLYDLDGKS
jgi:DNA repair and recombination protein RAD54B